ncbi:MAG: BlaI/MecI/CopY family transcriptional regulator [Ruminococcus sp.]|nr:BlaI/MecI/CopY family transcriptional regulator [Ruminococcus sp.]
MIKHMTKSEREIMELLWKSKKPLSCAEIVEISDDKSWKNSYVHSLIKPLLKKGIATTESFELVSRSYARKFAPKISYYEYILLSEFSDEDLRNTEKMVEFFNTFLQVTDNEELTEEIKDRMK